MQTKKKEIEEQAKQVKEKKIDVTATAWDGLDVQRESVHPDVTIRLKRNVDGVVL